MDLIQQMEKGMDSYSKGHKKIAGYVLEHYEKAAYQTAAKLGKNVGVSESTVVRFAMELGFDGYPSFQHSLQEIIRTRLTSMQRVAVTNERIGDGDVLSKVLSSDMEKIQRTRQEIDAVAFETAVDRLCNASNIYILGVRSSGLLASFLDYNLRMISDNVRLVQSYSGGEVFEQMLSIGERDVLLAISFPRYSKRIVNAVRFARDKGANVIALTDNSSSPIAPYANELLTAKSDMASFVDGLVAPMSVLNALLVALTRRKETEVTQRLHMLEEIWDTYDVYTEKASREPNV